MYVAAINEHEETLSKDETRTRYVLIDPILRALGWDVSYLQDVEAEYVTLERKKVDYALLGSNKAPLVLVEAKRLNEPHVSKNISQLLMYCVEAGVRYGVLTDGNQWEMYDTSTVKPLKDKRTMYVVLTSHQPAVAATHLLDLWKNFVREGGSPRSQNTGYHVDQLPIRRRNAPQMSHENKPEPLGHLNDKSFTIVINGREYTVDSEEVSFAYVVDAAYPDGGRGDLITYTVLFYSGGGRPSEGGLGAKEKP